MTWDADYMRDYRARHPELREQNKRTARAYARASARLRRRFPAEFEAYLAEERVREGLPAERGRPGRRKRDAA